MSRSFAFTICALGLSGCLGGTPCPDMQFQRLTPTDRIVIIDNRNREIRTIQDQTKIGEITRFALSHASGWETPWAGTPVASVRANFYVGEKFIGDLGVGRNFLTAQGCSFFQSRKVSAKDREVILRLLAVKDPYVDQSENP